MVIVNSKGQEYMQFPHESPGDTTSLRHLSPQDSANHGHCLYFQRDVSFIWAVQNRPMDVAHSHYWNSCFWPHLCPDKGIISLCIKVPHGLKNHFLTPVIARFSHQDVSKQQKTVRFKLSLLCTSQVAYITLHIIHHSTKKKKSHSS